MPPRPKPWTRWWWQGSAVEPRSLTAQLQALAAAGIGGVEITPIYGVRGAEDRFIPYLSPQWMAMLDHTLREAARLKMGVDMATGTGWPFGGPWVGDDTAPRSIVHKTWTLSGGERLTEPVTLRQTPLVRAIGNQIHIVNEGAPGDPPRGAATQAPVIRPEARAIQIADLVEPVSANRNLQALALEQVKYPRDLPLALLMAYSDAGDALDLTSRVQADGSLDWTAPSGRWTLYAIFAGWHGKLVERAAPGGEGNVIDHFSADAIRKYLLPFDRAFKGHSLAGLRAFFNDSYEVDDATGEADWTPRLLRRVREAPRLRSAAATCQRSSARARTMSARACWRTIGKRSRICCSTRSRPSGQRGRDATGVRCATRRTDRRRASSISTPRATCPRPKGPRFSGSSGRRPRRTSPDAGWCLRKPRPGSASTSACGSPRSGRRSIEFFVAGVNHIVYHGTAYSPVGDPWPGWQFYASVEFNPQNAWWDDFAALNAYVARVQSFLQSGRPDTDVLLYYPFYESLTVRGTSLLSHFGGAAPPSRGTTFEKAAETLQAAGFTYDFVSDRQLRRARTENGRVTTEGATSYQTIVLPSSRYVPLETVAAGSGARARRRNGRVVRRAGRPTSAAWPISTPGERGSRPRSTRCPSVRPMRTASEKRRSAAVACCRAPISAACSRAPACGESRWSIAVFSSHGASTRWAASTSSAIHVIARSTGGCRSTAALPR